MLSRRKTWYLCVLLSALVGCNGPYNSGDRVLVDKFAYDADLGSPRRFEVVVFKFPPRPVENGVPKNYIKRLLGLPGELLAIFFGQIFSYYPDPEEAQLYHDPNADPTNLWRKEYMYMVVWRDGPEAATELTPEQIRELSPAQRKSLSLFNTPGKFQIVRKPPDVMMAMRRIVNDNDFQPSDFGTRFILADGNTRFISKRWVPTLNSGWVPDDAKGFVHKGDHDGLDWLRYQHILRPLPDVPADYTKPSLITDTMDYNSPIKQLPHGQFGNDQVAELNWVGNLMLECQLTVTRPEGEFRMEVSRGVFRYQARFDLASGQCSLYKLSNKGKTEQMLGNPVATRVKAPGEYSLRLANFDARLTLWVDDDLPFGDGHEYPPPEILTTGENLTPEELAERRGPSRDNDLEPASFGTRAADLKIHHVRLWRDTYYSRVPAKRDFVTTRAESEAQFWRSPGDWTTLQKIQPLIMYVQPGHFLCLGDNSPMSSDSRAGDQDWGLVPQRLLLGRVLMVYFPLNRAGPIR